MISKRLQWVINGLESRGVDFSCSSEYGEPGYSTDKELILFADWNQFDRSEMKAIESVAEIEWEDEWVTDGQGRAFRSSPDCYGWEMSWFPHDGEVVPWDEVKGGDLEDFGYYHEKGDTVFRCLPSSFPLEELQSVADLLEGDYETGFHPGQDDSPVKVLASLPAGRYIFRIRSVGKFDSSWEVWQVREESNDSEGGN